MQKSIWGQRKQLCCFWLWKQGRQMSTDIFMKWNLFPEEIKGEDDYIRRWLQEEYSFVETDTATTDYHFLCDIKNLGLSFCKTLSEIIFRQFLSVFSLKTYKTNKLNPPRLPAFIEFRNPDVKIAAVFC